MTDFKVCKTCGTRNYSVKTVLTEKRCEDDSGYPIVVIEEHRFDVCGHLDHNYPTLLVGHKGY